MPHVRINISGVKSRANPETPETLSEQILNFQVSHGWRSRNLEIKGDSLLRFISELCHPQYGWYPFLFWKGPLHGTARAGHEIPSSTGGASELLTTGHLGVRVRMSMRKFSRERLSLRPFISLNHLISPIFDAESIARVRPSDTKSVRKLIPNKLFLRNF